METERDRGAHRSGGEAGLTLVELLVACSLLSLLLVATLGLQAQARRAADASQEAAHRHQIAELAAELLRYHLGLAGHAGVSGAALPPEGASLAIDRGGAAGGSDALAVRYVEERWYQEPEPRALYFDVKRDGNGIWNLYQREEGATRQPAVQEVNSLRVVGFVDAEGAALPSDSPLPLDALAIELELGFSWEESRRMTVPLAGPLRVESGS